MSCWVLDLKYPLKPILIKITSKTIVKMDITVESELHTNSYATDNLKCLIAIVLNKLKSSKVENRSSVQI